MEKANTSKKSTEEWISRTDPDNMGYVNESHPSYGLIGISRVAGNTPLFDSSVQHLHFISLRIREARRVIHGPHEYVFADKQLIEIWMTESQFAQLITSPDVGDGVSCTIRDCQGDQDYGERYGRPLPPKPEPFTDKYHKELDKRAKLVIDSVKKAQDCVNELLSGETKPTKKNLDELRETLHMARMNAESNLPYVIEQMQEGVEQRMSNAISEFETYVSQILQARGLSHLQEDAPKLSVGRTYTLKITDGGLENPLGEKE